MTMAAADVSSREITEAAEQDAASWPERRENIREQIRPRLQAWHARIQALLKKVDDLGLRLRTWWLNRFCLAGYLYPTAARGRVKNIGRRFRILGLLTWKYRVQILGALAILVAVILAVLALGWLINNWSLILEMLRAFWRSLQLSAG